MNFSFYRIVFSSSFSRALLWDGSPRSSRTRTSRNNMRISKYFIEQWILLSLWLIRDVKPYIKNLLMRSVGGGPCSDGRLKFKCLSLDVLKMMTYKEIIWESLTKSRKFSALSAVRDSSQWKSNMKQIAMVHSRRLISTQSRSLHFLLLIFLTALLATHVATGLSGATAEGLFGSPQCQSDSLGALVRTKDPCVVPQRPPAAPAVRLGCFIAQSE